MDAQAVDHDIDGIDAVAVGLALKGDAVFVELLASRKLPHGRAGEFCESLGHADTLLERLDVIKGGGVEHFSVRPTRKTERGLTPFATLQ